MAAMLRSSSRAPARTPTCTCSTRSRTSRRRSSSPAHQGNVSHGVYEFTPRQQALVYSTNENGEFTQAWTYDICERRAASLIAAPTGTSSFVTYSESGRYRVSGTQRRCAHGHPHPRQLRAASEVRCRGVPPGRLAQIRFSRDEKQSRAHGELGHLAATTCTSSISERATRPATDAGAESADRGSRPGRERKWCATRASTGWRYPRILYRAEERIGEQPRCRRWCGCMAGRAVRAAPATRPRSSTSSTTATPCSPRTIAARPATARRSFTWTTSATATST